MPAAWVTSRAVAAGAYKTGDMSFKSDKTYRHLFWWMCGQLMQLAQMETSDSSGGGGGPLLSLPLPMCGEAVPIVNRARNTPTTSQAQAMPTPRAARAAPLRAGPRQHRRRARPPPHHTQARPRRHQGRARPWRGPQRCGPGGARCGHGLGRVVLFASKPRPGATAHQTPPRRGRLVGC